jgi:hypothetical protein
MQQSLTTDDALKLRAGSGTLNLGETGEMEGQQLTLARAALQWTYIVRNRRRWATVTEWKNQQAAYAKKVLSAFGVQEADLQKFARASMVEISVPWTQNEADNWPARVLPWEFVITSATEELVGDRGLAVIRHMNCKREAPRRVTGNKRVLFVISEPGPLHGLFQFETECELVRNNLRDASRPKNWCELSSPTEAELIDTLEKWGPAVVHFTGFDTHEALSALAKIQKKERRDFQDLWDFDPNSDTSAHDGYVLKGAKNRLAAIGAERLANILGNNLGDDVARTTGRIPPRLVVFNVYNSAARLASLAVSRGVQSAIGFQDSFDNYLAERFLSFFYGQLDWSDWDTGVAFRLAFEKVRSDPRLQEGSGIVHWSRVPLLTDQAKLDGVNEKIERMYRAFSDEREALQSVNVAPGDIAKIVKVAIKPFNEINYSILHNKRKLFEKFTLTPTSRAHPRIRGVTVKVSLDVGEGSPNFTKTLDVEYPSTDLSAEIHLSLTAPLIRAVHEGINASLLVEVVWGDHSLYCESSRVRLMPVDQWRDSDSDRRWLPSFVFPRDHFVSELLEKAQCYVRVLRDDPAAGFDGYQSVDVTAPVPTAGVDLQVQAIWSAIVHDMGLAYINPPPGYSSSLDSQRLRTPSMVRDHRSGTCIDLALLFAACLELINVFPVIFLLRGHAFPGYWRSNGYHDEFLQTRFDLIPEITLADSAEVEDDAWFFKQDTCREIMRYIQDGKLAPLETVCLTQNCGFGTALKVEMDHLEDSTKFEAMIDIELARELMVTPLPILREQT